MVCVEVWTAQGIAFFTGKFVVPIIILDRIFILFSVLNHFKNQRQYFPETWGEKYDFKSFLDY